jgi:hypothetical protein
MSDTIIEDGAGATVIGAGPVPAGLPEVPADAAGATAAIAALRTAAAADPKHPLNHAGSAGGQAFGQRLLELYQRAHGGVVDGDTNAAMLNAAGAVESVPTDATGYDLQRVRLPDAPPGQRRDEAADREWMTWARETAHVAGLNTQQWDNLVQAYNDLPRMQREDARVYSERVTAGLQQIWAGDFDKNLAGARAAVQAIERERPGFAEWLEGTGLGNHPNMIRLALDIARKRGLIK